MPYFITVGTLSVSFQNSKYSLNSLSNGQTKAGFHSIENSNLVNLRTEILWKAYQTCWNKD
jgi:hypothetical protein